jgi:hypothetical protein
MVAGLDPIQEQEKPPAPALFSSFDRLVGATEAIARATNDGDAL